MHGPAVVYSRRLAQGASIKMPTAGKAFSGGPPTQDQNSVNRPWFPITELFLASSRYLQSNFHMICEAIAARRARQSGHRTSVKGANAKFQALSPLKSFASARRCPLSGHCGRPHHDHL